MRRIMGSLVALSCVVSACSLTPTAAKRGVTPRSASSVKPVVAASARPVTSSPRPGASAKPTLLEGPTVLVKGKVEVDAHYLLSRNAGSLVSNNGGAVIALKGGSLISNNGLGLISDNGLGLISDNGLGLIANAGAGYRVRSADVALGTVLPVKGMAVIPVSMRTGEVVGKPVLTDETGAYALAVPEALQGSLRIVAKVPVSSKDDPIARDERLDYSLVVESKSTVTAANAQLDEDTALVTKYLRACFANSMKDGLLTDDVEATSGKLVKSLKAPELLLATLKGLVADLSAAGKAAKLKEKSDAEVEAVAQRVTDVLLSYIDLENLEIDPVALGRQDVEGAVKEMARPAMIDVLKQVRQAAKAKMTEDPLYFDSHPLIAGAKKPYEIRKPSDLGDFVVEELLIEFDERYADLKSLFTSIGIPVTQAFRLNTLTKGFVTTIGQTLLTNGEAKAKMLQAVEAPGR